MLREWTGNVNVHVLHASEEEAAAAACALSCDLSLLLLIRTQVNSVRLFDVLCHSLPATVTGLCAYAHARLIK